MDAMMLHGLIAVESAPSLELPSAPGKALHRKYPGAPQDEASAIELQPLTKSNKPASASRSHGPQPGTTTNANFSSGPELEDQSRPGTPNASSSLNNGSAHNDTAEAMQSIMNPYMNRWRLLAMCLINLSNGMSDSAPGALIPAIEEYYNIGYAVVSLIFVGNALGFIAGAFFVDAIRERLGRAKTLAVGQGLISLGYIPMVATAPYPAIVVSFFFVGFGMSINLAMGNVFCGSLSNSTTALSMMHGSYGIGGTVGPLLATSLVTVFGVIWSRYYALSLGLAALGGVCGTCAFWDYERDTQQYLGATGGQSAGAAAAPHRDWRADVTAMVSALSNRVVLLGAVFIFAYQGAEVSISGWVNTFLMDSRHVSDGSVGYVTAGFWGGITLGRFLLAPPAHRIGEKLFVVIVVVGAGAFQLVVWLVPNLIGNAVAVAIVGLLLGPVYPCAAAVFMRNISKQKQVSGMGVISAFGSSGGAAAPFTTGLLAQAVGTFVLHPIVIALFVVMMVCWYALPNKPKRSE
ncbi:major facilitator superfamily domain-containing protein [Pseudoneurospora amorphoporcata]|uniref:Major facilitator superfamily domain-containing protein n=1 Tax=Pseudoneurospora amorphoporcata TaxID=241081 RepID=A0AAN6SIU7_9PEZI|nr:major facilitator superfamily domain-containing protein [Pseudoneurospora amorphoporcata]